MNRYAKMMDLYKAWYSRPDIKYEMIKFLKNRETAFITKDRDFHPNGSRMHKVNSTQHLDINILCVPLRLNHPYNIYHSVAKYKQGIPNQTLNFLDKSASEYNQRWKESGHIQNIYTYDFIIDIDGHSHDPDEFNLVKESAIKLHRLFLFNGVPHEIRFTGMGFHFIVPDMGTWTQDYSPDMLGNLYFLLSTFAKLLYKNVSEMIDLKVYDSRRVIKCPYSLSVYDEDTAYLCYPIMTTEELYTFDITTKRITDPWQYLGIIRNRGTFRFCQDQDSGKILNIKWQETLFKNNFVKV